MLFRAIIVISFISSLLVGCKETDDSPESIGHYYVNYKDTSVIVDESWFVPEGVSAFTGEKSGVCYIKDRRFNTWLKENDFVTGGMSRNTYKNENTCRGLEERGDEVAEPMCRQTRGEFLSEQKDSIEYYYVGKEYVSSAFESHLIESSTYPRGSSRLFERITYMFNIRDTRLLSIVVRQDYYSCIGEGVTGYSYTARVAPETYTYYFVQLSSDLIYEDQDMSREQELPEERITYTIDGEGYLEKVSIPRG